MATRWARFTRGWLAAIFSTLAAAVSHTLAGAEAPGALALVMGLAFAVVVCVALTGKRLSLPRLAAAVVTSQFGFHTLFSTMGDLGTPVLGHVSGHVHSALAEVPHLTAMPMDAAAHHTTALMWLGHAVAALATVVALRFGERAYWGLREGAGRVIRSLSRPIIAPVATAAETVVPTARPFAPRFFVILAASLAYRGPPIGAVA